MIMNHPCKGWGWGACLAEGMANAKALGWERMTERNQQLLRIVRGSPIRKDMGKLGWEPDHFRLLQVAVRNLDLIASATQNYWRINGLGRRQGLL